MTTVQKIATQIAARGKAMGWKPDTKTADTLNLECWLGAWSALLAIGHDDAEHVGIVTMVISARGYRETLHIAADAPTS